MRKIIVILIMISISFLEASHENMGGIPVAQALSLSYVAMAEGAGAIPFNPAGLPLGNRIEALTYYRILYGGLGERFASYGLYVKYGNIGIGIEEKGATLEGDYEGKYDEGLYSLSGGYPLSDNLSAGLNLNLYKFQDPRFGASYSFGVDVGLLATITKIFRVGAFYKNITLSRIRGDKLPSYLDAGISMHSGDFSRTSFTFHMSPDYGPGIAFGEEISLFRGLLNLRSGIYSEEDLKRFSFGIGINKSGLHFDYAVIATEGLPLSHSFGILYRR